MNPAVFFLDTEFNSYNGQLISLALVPLEVAELAFYKELVINEPIHPWVAEHVMPFLENKPITLDTFQTELEIYLSKYDRVTIIADWFEDVSYMSRVIITGPGYAIKTPMISFIVDRNLAGTSTVPHNAFYDAVGNRDFYIKNVMSE